MENCNIQSTKPIDGVCTALLSEYTTYNRNAFNYYAAQGMNPHECLQAMAANNQTYEGRKMDGHHLIYTYTVDGVKYYRASSKRVHLQPYRYKNCGAQAYYSKEDPGYSDMVFQYPDRICARSLFH